MCNVTGVDRESNVSDVLCANVTDVNKRSDDGDVLYVMLQV